MRQKIAQTPLLSIAVLIVAIACSRSPSAPLPVFTENTTPSSTASPPPTATPTRYNLSGIVTDEAGSPVANAQLALYYDNTFKVAKTATDAGGHYNITFATSLSAFDGNARMIGAIYYEGGGDYENYFVQAVPWGTADVVINLRLRRIRTVNAGQSIAISIDPDSSLAYDAEDWLRMDWGVWEKFHIRVGDAGTLSIDTGADVASAPTVAVFGLYRNGGQPPPGKRWLIVEANSLLEVRVAIPARMAPQRYNVTTFLQ